MSIVFTAPVIPVGPPAGWQNITPSAGNISIKQGYIGPHTYMPFNGKILNERDGAWEFDPVALTYGGTVPANDPGDFWNGAWATLSSGKVLAVRRLNSQTYDPSTNLWTNTTNTMDISNPRIVAPAAGGAFRFGGTIAGAGSLPDQTASIYNEGATTWSTLGQALPNKMADHDALPLADGRILVGGGWHTFNAGDRNLEYYFYDTTNDTYTQTASIPLAWWRGDRMGMMQLNNGMVYGVGGNDDVIGTKTNLAVLFDVENEVWSLGTQNLPRVNMSLNDYSASLLPDGRVALHGGFDSFISTNL